MLTNWRAFIDSKPWDGSKSLYLVARDPANRTNGYITKFEVTAAPEGSAAPGPAMTESYTQNQDGCGDVTNFLQAILDAAWTDGMRPNGFKDHTNEVTAIRAHLADMRFLAKVTSKEPS